MKKQEVLRKFSLFSAFFLTAELFINGNIDIDKNGILAKASDLIPWNHKLLAFAKSEHPAVEQHHDGNDTAGADVNLHIVYVAEAFSVADIDDFLVFQIVDTVFFHIHYHAFLLESIDGALSTIYAEGGENYSSGEHLGKILRLGFQRFCLFLSKYDKINIRKGMKKVRKISKQEIEGYRYYLINEEKSLPTIYKYIHDVRDFSRRIGDKALSKSVVLEYKAEITARHAPASVNSMLSSINGFFEFIGRHDLCVKMIKVQRQIFSSGERELTKNEYECLLVAAKRKKNKRLYLLMQTICSTGIRVSELRAITVEAVQRTYAEINCKGKSRRVFLPSVLCKRLKQYIKGKKITSGPIFITKNGKPLDRSNIWSEMKKLCKSAGVSEKKVFPHNLRHLFARTYYAVQKDIVRLADILGHSSINTTRIYTVESGEVHRRQIEQLGFLRC